MRDKVKRFISILMTALMLVNLLPVGALAEGFTISNSVQSIGWWDADVYVYVEVTGDKAGLTINPSGWYTIGKSTNVPGMGIPSSKGPRSFRKVGVWPETVLDNSRFTRWTDNQKIDLDQITWTEFYIDNGADDYVPAGKLTWHMNGTIDIKHLPSVYTIKYVDYDTKELIESYEKTGHMGDDSVEITAPDSLKENLYSFYFVDGHPKKQIVDFKKDKGELTFYYKKNTANYTVNYYLEGTQEKVKDSITGTAALRDTVNPDTEVTGYTLVPGQKTSLTIGKGENVLNLYYTKNSYKLTVNYKYEDGSKAAESHEETLPYQSDYSVTSPELEGYTADKLVVSGKMPAGNVEETVTYKKNSYKLTVNYKYEDGSKAAESHEETLPYQSDYSVTSPELEGYTADKLVVSGKMPAGNVEETVTYKKNSYKLTVNYKYEDGSKAAESHEAELPYQSDYSVTSPELEGYTADKLVASGKMPAGNVEETVTYTPRTDLSYTVNYYWNGTEIPVKPSKTVLHQTFGAEATESPIGADDYTPVSNEPKKIKIGADSTQNVITFYYYRNVKLIANSDEKTYDGKPKSVSGYTSAVAEVQEDGTVEYVPWTGEPLTFEFVGAFGSGKDAGDHEVTFKEGSLGENNGLYYVKKVQPGTLTIKPAPIKLRAPSASKTYDGTPLKAEDYGYGYEGNTDLANDFKSISVDGSQTMVGSSASSVTYELKQGKIPNNYNIQCIPGTLTITPVTAEVLVEITGNTASVTYDGKLHSVEGYAVDSISNSLYTANDFTYNGVAKAEGTDAATYPMNLAETRFENTNTNFKNVRFEVVTDGSLTISKRPVTLTSADLTKVYDGTVLTNGDTPVTVGGDGFADGEGATYDFTGSQTDVGKSENKFTYKANEKTKLTNYAITTEFGTLEVTPVTDKVTVTIKGGKSSVTYNGEEHTVSGYKVSDISNPLYTANDFSFSGTAEAKGKNAGLYKMGLKAADFANTSNNFKNVEFVVADGQLEITKRPVMLTSADLIKVYDGTPLTNGDTPVKEEFGTEDAFPEGEGVTYTFKGSQTNAGSSKNMFTYAWNEGTNKDNYTIYQVEGDLVVTPIDGIKVTITGHKDTQTYDGKEHFVFGFDAEPSNALYNPKEDMQFNGTDVDMTAKGTDAGQYDIGLTAEHFTNKSNNFTNVTFVVTDGYVKITPRAVTLTSETAGKTYDGTALEKPVVTVGGDGFVEGQVKEIKATGSVTNAGSVANTITFTPDKETFKDGNYAITKNEGTLTIAKRSVLLTSQSATKTYDGSALTRPAVTITGDGFVSGELAKVEATGSITNVGSTPNAIQYTTTGAFNPANYSIALSVGTLTVTAKPEPEPRRTFNLTINYVYQNGKRAAASYNRGGLKNGETFDITSPVIAGYTASETVVSGTIDNRDIKVTVIYTADGVNLDDYGVPLGLGNITMNVGDCFE